MTRNISIQTYLPPHIAAWVDAEAARARTSRSLWIANILTDLFQGQELRDDGREQAASLRKNITFVACGVDGLLAGHPDHTLRQRVHEAYHRKLAQAQAGDQK
jgi:hypothetical protein